MSIVANDGDSAPVNVIAYAVDFEKAKTVKTGDMVSWKSSGGNAEGKVVRVVSSGKINVPDSSFTIAGTEDDPAVLIQLYRDGKPTETKVGHKMSTLSKSLVIKHGSHDQRTHGAWAGNGAPAEATAGGSDTNSGLDPLTQRSLERGKKALEGRDYKEMLRDYDKMEAKWRKKLDKPYDPEGPEEYGDPQDLAQTDFYRKYGASIMDVQMYAESLPFVGKHLDGQHDQSTHAPHVSQGGEPEHRGSDDDPKHMDNMDLGSGRPRRKRELTMAERILINRIASPLGNYTSQRTATGYQPKPVLSRPTTQGGVTGYVPDPANNPS